MVKKRKKKIKDTHKKIGLAKIANLTSKSFGSVLSNYKKNKELEKIKTIKLQKLEEKSQILKERKDLKIWEERLIKESNRIKLNEDELRLKEKEFKSKDEKQKVESDRLIKKDEDLIQIAKELRTKEKGTKVIDNSSAWRMDKNIPLVVPEINGNSIKKSNIIANPNCSTIQMVLALKEIHNQFNIDRIVVSTYQSVTGTGAAAVKQMMDERNQVDSDKIYPHPIDKNCFPHGGDFLPNGYTTEEMKLVDETRKIFSSPEIKVTATVVRIPVIGGHSMAVNIRTKNNFNLQEIYDALSNTKGVVIKDDNLNFDYPMPINAHEKNEVFVGRIREDHTIENGLNLWIVADNLRKGAATNAVQIAQYMIKNNLV